MHSRIVILDNEPELDLDSVFEEMLSYGNGVDYVCNSGDPFDEDYRWFMNYVEDFGFEKVEYKSKGFKIADESKFWNAMQRDVEKLLEDGMKESRFRIYDRTGMKNTFWIYYEGQLWTLPYFVEFNTRNGTGKKNEFKIYEFLDYHY